MMPLTIQDREGRSLPIQSSLAAAAAIASEAADSTGAIVPILLGGPMPWMLKKG
ncbi:MAG: hypothetical protein ACK4K7_16060 [Allosphingosinicella sp.]|uniref:hypothetical protein n=1 Tax=Allosphingosinicella sp. TaxID=2823234 RepID=UPI003962F0B7